MSSVTVICPNQRRYTIKVTPGTVLHKVVEEACLKSGYDVNCCVVKNQNRTIDLALPFRLSGLPNNSTLELVVVDKPQNEKVEIALQLPDGQRRMETVLGTTISLAEVLNRFQDSFGQNLLSPTGGLFPCIVYMSKKYSGPELHYTTLASIGITSGKVLLRYQTVEMSVEEVAKLEEKAAYEKARVEAMTGGFEAAKRENEERERLEADRLARFEAEVRAKEEEENRRREEEARKQREEAEAMEVEQAPAPQPPHVPDRLPDIPTGSGGGWSFDSPFAQRSNDPPSQPPENVDRLAHLNSLLQRMNRSIATGSADNMVSVIASSGRMTLDQIEAASEQMETEADPAPRPPPEPCSRNIVIFPRVEEIQEKPMVFTDVPDEFFNVNIDDVKTMQKDLKNQVRLQTQRSMVSLTAMKKKNYELKCEAWQHSVIRFAVEDLLIQANFKSEEPVSRLFEEVNRFFRERVKFTLTATLNQKLTNTEKENLIEKELAPKSTLRVKVEGITNPIELLRSDIFRGSHADADAASQEWLSINTIFRPYTGVMAEEERSKKRAAGLQDYHTASSSSRPAAPSGPKWFKHK